MRTTSVAIMIYGDSNSGRNALTEEKYKDLANAFTENGFETTSVLYNDGLAGKLADELLQFDVILVWINPIEQGGDRKVLDALLTDITNKGCFVSTHPQVILKMGTKEVLYETKDMDWGGDTRIYRTFKDFTGYFIRSLKNDGTRVLKQYRGNGGNGVFKIVYNDDDSIAVIHAKNAEEVHSYSIADFHKEFEPYFLYGGLLIDQEWSPNINNGMVRCYLTGAKVSGFGYQEVNALYQQTSGYVPPGKRFYFTENCGLFADLKNIMENKWVPRLMEKLSLEKEMMPIIWDADFFINDPYAENTSVKYTLCEINVSCVSPFPPSSIKFIVEEIKRIKNASKVQ